MNKILFCLSVWFLLQSPLYAQTIYVDAINGKAGAAGTKADPLPAIDQAIHLANTFKGKEPVSIILASALYVLNTQLVIKTMGAVTDTMPFTIEALQKPGDEGWRPAFSPVIISASPNNSMVQFPHCVGFLVAKSNVHFRGIKFGGNAHPQVKYYYPITREDSSLLGLDISNCYFIGEKNVSPIQSGAWVSGAGVHVDHCIFYNCRNALVLIRHISDWSLTHSIIYGAYESAIYYGSSAAPFTFRDNIVTACRYVWLRPGGIQPPYTFHHSVITGNDHFMGLLTRNGEMVSNDTRNLTEDKVRHSGQIRLVQVTAENTPGNYLHCVPGSDGSDLGAGVINN